MAFFDTGTSPFEGMNIFGARPNEALTGLLANDPNALEKLKNQSLMSGLLSAGATYLAQPKNQNIGLGAILGKTYLGGMQGAQGAYDAALKGKIDAYNIAKTQKQIEMEGAPDIQKLMTWRNNLNTNSPTYQADLQAVNNEIAKVSTHAPPQSIVNVNTQVPFKEEIQKKTADKLITNYENLQNAPATIDALRRAKTLATNNPIIGSLGDKKLATVQFFNNTFGTQINPQAVKDTTELKSVLFSSVMENLKKMDATPSESQQAQMKEAFGNITTDPAALQQVLDFWESQALNKVNQHNARVDSLKPDIKKDLPYDIKINIPPASANKNAPANATVIKYDANGRRIN